MRFLTFGIPLGSSLVLVALLGSILTGQKALNFTELLLIQQFSVQNHLPLLIWILLSAFLAIELWIGVILKGKPYHLTLWIGISCLALLTSLVLAMKPFLYRSAQNDGIDWRSIRNLLTTLFFEPYLICVAVQTSQGMWKRDPNLSSSMNNNLTYENDGGSVTQNPPSTFLSPIGYSFKDFINFYKSRYVITARLFITLDIVLSLVYILTKNHPLDLYESRFYGLVPEWTNSLTITEDILIRGMRIILGLITLFLIAKKKSATYARGSAFGYVVLIFFSSIVFILQFFSVNEDVPSHNEIGFYFLQSKFICDIIFRMFILHFLYNCIENSGYFVVPFSDDLCMLNRDVPIPGIPASG